MLRVVGDVHGHIEQYQQVIWNAEASIQLGDMGFTYSKLENNPNHKFLVETMIIMILIISVLKH